MKSYADEYLKKIFDYIDEINNADICELDTYYNRYSDMNIFIELRVKECYDQKKIKKLLGIASNVCLVQMLTKRLEQLNNALDFILSEDIG